MTVPNRFHSFDPRARILFFGLVGVQPFFHETWIAPLSSFCVLLLIVLAVGIPVPTLLRQIPGIFWFTLAIVLLNLFTADGHILFRFGNLVGTREGLLAGMRLSSSLVILLWASYLLLHTTPSEEIVDALRLLLSPFGRVFGTFVLLVTLTVNLVAVLITRARRLGFSFRARGIDTGSTLRKRFRFILLATPRMFASAARIIPQLANAMESRCYDSARSRTMYSHLRFTARDWVLIAFGGVMFLCSVLLPA